VSDITVLAGGWSAKQFDLEKLPGTVIAVNDAAIYAPRIDVVVSMDRLWAEARFSKACLFGKPLWLRRRTLMNIEWRAHECVTAFENDHTAQFLSDQPGTLDGGHSGMCAINLAYHMRPKRLYLVGMDLRLGPRGERHWFPDYPWKDGGGSKAGKLAEWARQMKRIEHQLAGVGIESYLCGTPPAIAYGFRTLTAAQLAQRWR
jgi:hypothetical protein